jgi:hypothetical protein
MPMHMLRVSRSLARSAFAIAVLVAGPSGQALAQNVNPGVAPPRAHAFGHSYSVWSAEWWKWWLSIPAADHPALGGDCRVGQAGKVFYLSADYTGSEEVSCTVPTGKVVLFPVVNSECSSVEPPPFYGESAADREACARCWTDLIDVSSLQATLDGRALADLGAYRVISPDFTFLYPEGWIYGDPPGPGTGQSVSDGYWVLLAPLSAGEHTLSFGGHVNVPQGACGSDFGGDIEYDIGATYQLTVTGH